MGPYPEYFFHKMGDVSGLEKIFIIDYSTSQLERAKKVLDKHFQNFEELETYYLIVDHDQWPFKPNTFDLIIDNLTLHLCNDVQVSLKRLLISQKPDGCLLGNAYGNNTLNELRYSFYLSENERYNGVSPRSLKFFDMTTFGNIMSRSGYQLTSFHTTIYKECYESPWHMIDNLSQLCQTNCLKGKKDDISKDMQLAMTALYQSNFEINKKTEIDNGTYKVKNDGEYQVPEKYYEASFDIVNFIGWKYDMNQPQAKQRGSQTVSFAEMLKEMEEEDDGKAGPLIRSGTVQEEDESNENK